MSECFSKINTKHQNGHGAPHFQMFVAKWNTLRTEHILQRVVYKITFFLRLEILEWLNEVVKFTCEECVARNVNNTC